MAARVSTKEDALKAKEVSNLMQLILSLSPAQSLDRSDDETRKDRMQTSVVVGIRGVSERNTPIESKGQ